MPATSHPIENTVNSAGAGFPVNALPRAFTAYVHEEAARCGACEEFVIVTALAHLAGVAGDSHIVLSEAGTPTNVCYNLIVAVPESFAIGLSLNRRIEVLEQCQRERLAAAAALGRKQIALYLNAPLHQVPDLIPGDLDPRQVIDARVKALHTVQRPMFFLEGGGSREIRDAFAACADATLLLSFTRDDVLDRLLAPKMDREGRRFVDLIGRLANGGAIELPRSRGGDCALAQPKMGFMAITNPASLQLALLSDRKAVQALLQRSILLTVDAGHPAGQPPAIRPRGNTWNDWVRSFLKARRQRNCAMEPHPIFYHELDTWWPQMQGLVRNTPAHLQVHLSPFAELPRKLATLFLGIETYGGFRDGDAAKGAIEITQWYMARTLITADRAYWACQQAAEAASEERMLEKIRERPTDFVRLRRRFSRQRKDMHQRTLDSLLNQGRVRREPDGRLVAI